MSYEVQRIWAMHTKEQRLARRDIVMPLPNGETVIVKGYAVNPATLPRPPLIQPPAPPGPRIHGK